MGIIRIENFSLSTLKARRDFINDIKSINEIASKWTNAKVTLDKITFQGVENNGK